MSGRETLSGAPEALSSWTDTHCHVHDTPEAAERRAILQRATDAGVRRMICIGTDEERSRAALALAAAGAGEGAELYATVGLHPHYAEGGTAGISLLLSELKDDQGGVSPRLVGVGECGLDYYYDNSAREAQRRAFAAQVALAREHDLTLVIHTRDAFDDTLAILREEGVPERTVFHCFTGGPADAERCLETGAFLSFSGIVTFKNAAEVREAARLCPLDRVLVETDSPFLTPVPHRGETNEPCYVPLVGEAIAKEKDLSTGEVAAITSDNAEAAFRLGAS